MKLLLVFLISLFTLASCGVLITDRNMAPDLIAEDESQTVFINSFKKPCVGVAPMSCLQIQRKSTLDPKDWEYFYDEIEGFDFEPGYIYKIKIKTENLDIDNLPADSSSIRYTYVETVEKWLDERMRINDIWALTAINKTQMPSAGFLETQEHPRLEINISEMKIFGNDGCNELEGNIITVDENRLELTEISTTKMSCPNMDIPSHYKNALQKVRRYNVKNLELLLYDNKNQEILRFKKVD